MDVNLIFKIAAVGILVSVLSQVLKHSGREYPAVILPVGKKGAYEYHTDLRSCCCRYASCCAV